MGIGGGIFLVALGAILAFAIHANLAWIDVNTVGWVLILAGLSILGLTIWFWQQRRKRNELTLVEQSRIIHDPVNPHLPEAPDTELPPGPQS
jgi:cyanate permease